MREDALPRSLPSEAESLRKIVADCEATDYDLRTRLVDIRAVRQVARQAVDPRYQCPEARAHLRGELERLRASLARPGVISPIIQSYLSIPSAESFVDPAEFFRLVLGRVIELHTAASRRLVAVQAAGTPAPSAASETPQSPPKRSRRRREVSLIQKAIAILIYRAKRSGESIRVEDIAVEAGCTAQNLRRSPEFRRAFRQARDARVRRGWKIDGVADAADDATLS
ncbi:MAG TPA: hypothetical protein VFF52_09870 [Isosphaeraceae bacterium]|nr:hypothetical protein [Isosphaeraceae bacterium]